MAESKITPREEDYSQWYQEVIAAGDLAEQSPVKGCMVIRPTGMALWENLREQLAREWAWDLRSLLSPNAALESAIDGTSTIHAPGMGEDCSPLRSGNQDLCARLGRRFWTEVSPPAACYCA